LPRHASLKYVGELGLDLLGALLDVIVVGRIGQKLFLWEKPRAGEPARGTILFVHGSSMAATRNSP